MATVRYVTLTNGRPWIVHGYRNTRGRGSAGTLDAEVNEAHSDYCFRHAIMVKSSPILKLTT